MWVLTFCVFYLALAAEKPKVDSLKQLLMFEKTDSVKVDLLCKMGWEMQYTQIDSGIAIINKALLLAKKINWNKGILAALNNRGSLYQLKAEFKLALEDFEKILEIKKKAGNKSIAGILCNIGIIYCQKGNYILALEYYLRALAIAEETGNKLFQANILNNISSIYLNQQNHETALKYAFRALALKDQGNKNTIGSSLSKIGSVYNDKGDYHNALVYINKALAIFIECNNLYGISYAYAELGGINIKLGNNKKALDYFYKAKKINEQTGIVSGWAHDMCNIGHILTLEKKYGEAERNLLEALDVFNKNGVIDGIKVSEEYLSDLYFKKGQNRLALEHYKNYIQARDSIQNEASTKKQTELEMNYEFDKKEAAAKLEQEKKEAVSVAESKKQKIIIYSVCGILILVIGFDIFAYRNFLQKQKANVEITNQKHVIEQKQKEILDSIYYAKRIQMVLLPSEKLIERDLERLTF